MAKAKILADTISITSEILTDENIRKAELLSPSVLKLEDLDLTSDTTVLYEVVSTDDEPTFTKYGASFKDGKSIGRITTGSPDSDERDEAKLIVGAILTKINAIEEQVKSFLDEAPDFAEDVEFLD